MRVIVSNGLHRSPLVKWLGPIQILQVLDYLEKSMPVAVGAALSHPAESACTRSSRTITPDVMQSY